MMLADNFTIDSSSIMMMNNDDDERITTPTSQLLSTILSPSTPTRLPKMYPWWRLSSFDELFEHVGVRPDPRTQHLLWVNTSPIFVLWGAFNFVMFARVLGPELMRNLPAFDIRWFMFIYNVLMSLANITAVYNVIPLSDYFRVLLNFEYPDRNDMSPFASYLIHMGWMYWMSKILDCWDTCFFVLRKKYAHITLLHVYHHCVVPVFGYLLMRINPLLPCVFLFSFINSTIHVIMYSYYALAALGPWIQKYLWWKKYITIMQLWQFVLYGIYGGFVWMFQTNYPVFWLYFALTQPPFFFYLFYDFYLKAYNIKRPGNLWTMWRRWRQRRQRRQQLRSEPDYYCFGSTNSIDRSDKTNNHYNSSTPLIHFNESHFYNNKNHNNHNSVKTNIHQNHQINNHQNSHQNNASAIYNNNNSHHKHPNNNNHITCNSGATCNARLRSSCRK